VCTKGSTITNIIINRILDLRNRKCLGDTSISYNLRKPTGWFVILVDLLGAGETTGVYEVVGLVGVGEDKGDDGCAKVEGLTVAASL